MSDHDWFKVFVSGTISGAFLLFVAAQLYLLGVEGHTAEERACSEQQRSDPFLRPFLMKDQEETLATKQQSEEAKKRPQPTFDYCGLVAQQAAADAAKGTEFSSWATTALTGIGVLLLWWTLQATRRTLIEAEKATSLANKTFFEAEKTTEAAVAQIELSKDATYRELRPYLVPAGTTIELREEAEGTIYRIEFMIKNAGSTPAKITRIVTRTIDAISSGGGGGGDESTTISIVGPNCIYSTWIGTGFGGKARQDGARDIHAGICLTYTDYADRKTTETFIWYFPIKDLRLKKIEMPLKRHVEGHDPEIDWLHYKSDDGLPPHSG